MIELHSARCALLHILLLGGFAWSPTAAAPTWAADAPPLAAPRTADDPGPPEPAEESTADPVAAAPTSTEELGPGPPEPAEESRGEAAAPQAPPWAQPTLPAPPTPALAGAGDAEHEQRRGPRELLELAGIEGSHFFMIQDDQPLAVDEHESLLKMLYRVRKFDLLDISIWTQRKLDWQKLADDPKQYRTEMFSLVGRVRKVVAARPPAEVMRQYELEQYYLCNMEVGPDRLPAIVLTTRIPKRWPIGVEIDERASAAGLFFKTGPLVAGVRQLVFLAPRVSWHPDRMQDEAPRANFGMTLLGDMGMDVSLLDQVELRSRIGTQDREAFYQMLWAVDQTETQQLLRHAQQALARDTVEWRREQGELSQQIAALRQEIAQQQKSQQPTDELTKQLKKLRIERAVVDRALERAGQGASSIFPLFNRSDEQRGALVVLEGAARRAVKIVVSSEGGDANSDIRARYGIDHYYEIEMFTPDSENNPIVVCARQLPPGMPEGENINEGIRVAGFFFKSWAFHTQKGAVKGADGKRRSHQQLAPLLIAREPILLPPPEPQGSLFGVFACVIFLGAMGGIWFAAWWFNRSDEQFHKRVIARTQAGAADGTSLNEIGLTAEDKPDFSHLG